MGYFASMRSLRESNEQNGMFWFSPKTMRFFRSRVGGQLYGGRYFTSSERGPDGVRRYSVRECDADGAVHTVGAFQAYATRNGALGAIRRLLREAQRERAA